MQHRQMKEFSYNCRSRFHSCRLASNSFVKMICDRLLGPSEGGGVLKAADLESFFRVTALRSFERKLSLDSRI